MKKLLVFLLCLFSISCFAEPLNGNAPISAPNCTAANPWPADAAGFSHDTFCGQFTASAYCHCEEKYTKDYCENRLKIAGIYNAMIGMYGTIEKACAWQAQQAGTDGYVDQATCIAQWNYYRDASNPCPAA